MRPQRVRAAVARGCTLAACATAMLVAVPGYAADDLPPPIGAQPSGAQPPGAQPPPASDSGAASAPGTSSESAPTTSSEALPGGGADASGAEPAPPKAEKDVRIEQKHVGRRVSEVIVTPAGFTYHYSLIHLDDQDPGTTPLQQHQELSVPRFFRFDF